MRPGTPQSLREVLSPSQSPLSKKKGLTGEHGSPSNRAWPAVRCRIALPQKRRDFGGADRPPPGRRVPSSAARGRILRPRPRREPLPPGKWYQDSNPSVRLRRPAPFTQGSLIRCAVGANSIVPWKVRRKEGGGEAAPFFWVQHILAPAGILSSSMTRWSFSSPFSVWTAEMSIPQLSWPIIFLGGRLTMASRVLPTSSSGS